MHLICKTSANSCHGTGRCKTHFVIASLHALTNRLETKTGLFIPMKTMKCSQTTMTTTPPVSPWLNHHDNSPSRVVARMQKLRFRPQELSFFFSLFFFFFFNSWVGHNITFNALPAARHFVLQTSALLPALLDSTFFSFFSNRFAVLFQHHCDV